MNGLKKTSIALIVSLIALGVCVSAAVYLWSRQMVLANLKYVADKKVMQARLELLNVSDLTLIQQQVTIDWGTYHAPEYDVQTSIGVYGVAYDFNAFYGMVSAVNNTSNYAGPIPLLVYYFISDTGSSVDYAFWTTILVDNNGIITLLWGNGNGR